ncbi:Fc receptor-like protein 2 [Mixophyes fleayi]|uniref:Fc receptor-like protein 2 n=1 Tax=Mixophyes fleayi TaxID=3061075 RepID=UPI003F4DFA03
MPTLLLFLVFISSFVDHSQATFKPWVSLAPNWNKVYRGSVTLTCNINVTGWKEHDYKWYRNNQGIFTSHKALTIGNVEEKHSGDYQCETTDSERSDPVRLDVSKEWLILQAPPYVYEGDTLTLRCHGWNDKFKEYSSFYQDNSPIPSTNFILDIENVTRRASGNYRCTRERWNVFFYKTETAETFVSVHELFSVPAIKLVRSLVMEGDDLMLTCDTTLAPPRQTTGLQYAFYKDGRNVQEFSFSDTYRVPSAQLEDSGNYTCEVGTSTGSLRKISDKLFIQIRELFKSPEIRMIPAKTVTEGAEVRLQCVTTANTGNRLLYTFYKDSQTIQGATTDSNYVILHTEEEHTGNYKCSVQTTDGNVQKNSPDLHLLVQKTGPTSLGSTSPGSFSDGGLSFDHAPRPSDRQVDVDQPQLTVIPDVVAVGDEIVLLCESTRGSLPIHYRFYHDGIFLGNITVQEKKPAELRLTIKSPTMSGPYYCDSHNYFSTQKQLSKTVNLLVMDPQSDFSLPMEEEEGSTVWPALGILLLIIIVTVVLLFMYRHKMAPLFTRCVQQQPNTDQTFVKARARVGQRPTNEDIDQSHSTNNDQEEYSNIPTMKPPIGEDICYAYIEINRTQEASATPTKRNDDHSVTYSAVKYSETSLETRASQETSNPTDLYQNFTVKEH